MQSACPGLMGPEWLLAMATRQEFQCTPVHSFRGDWDTSVRLLSFMGCVWVIYTLRLVGHFLISQHHRPMGRNAGLPKSLVQQGSTPNRRCSIGTELAVQRPPPPLPTALVSVCWKTSPGGVDDVGVLRGFWGGRGG